MQPVADEQRALFARVAELTGVRRDRAFARLVALCPVLADIPRTRKEEPLADAYQRVGAALKPLLGPDADTDDTLLRSHTAHDIAFEHLTAEEPVELTAQPRVYTARIGAVLCQRSLSYGDRVLLITGGADATARVLDLADGTVVHTLTGHDGPVRAVDYTYVERWRDDENGQTRLDGWRAVVTGGEDGTVRLWNVETGEQVHTLTGHTGPVVAVDTGRIQGEIIRVRPRRLLSGGIVSHRSVVVTASMDGTARAWDADTGTVRHVLTGHDGPLTDVGAAQIGERNLAVTAGIDGTARVWDLADGSLVHVLAGHEGPIRAVRYLAFHERQRIAITCGEDATVRVWEPNTGTAGSTLRGAEGPVVDALLLAGPQWMVAAASADGTARLWDFGTGELLRTYAGHDGPLTGVPYIVVDDRDLLVTSGADGTVRLWDIETGASQGIPTGQDGAVTALSCLQMVDDPIAVTSSADGIVRVRAVRQMISAST